MLQLSSVPLLLWLLWMHVGT